MVITIDSQPEGRQIESQAEIYDTTLKCQCANVLWVMQMSCFPKNYEYA